MGDYTKNPCDRCGHSPDDHRLDDTLNLSPTDPAAPFRCIVGLYAWDSHAYCGCPDFMGEALSWSAT